MREETTGTFRNADGLNLFYRFHAKAGDKAAVVVCHGLGEHSGRYENLYEILDPNGFSYFALDHRGHGRSEGKRGTLDSFDQFIFGVKKMVEMAHKTLKGKKVFLFGHSMGGLISIQYALRFPETIDALVASSPALQVAVEVPAVKAFMGRLLSNVLPALSLSNELDPNLISHDKEVVRAYIDDPLVHDRISTRLYTEMTSAMDNSLNRAGSLLMPLLMLHGTDDKFVHPDGAKKFFESASSKDKTLKMYQGFYHETINELGKASVLADIRAWLLSHIAS
jgi:acylglycerol lipase